MAEMENQGAAAEAMTVENPQENAAEVTAGQLMEGLSSAEQQEEEPAQEQEEQQSPEDAARSAYVSGIQALYDAGWPQEEVAALIADPTALREIRDGKTVGQAAYGFMKRQQGAQQQTKPATKKSVPTVKNASAAAKKSGSRIREMSKADFQELSKRAYQAMMDGKDVSFD